MKNIFFVLISSLFYVDQDLFLNFFSSFSGFVTPTQNRLLKWGAKDASRGAKDASGDGSKKDGSNEVIFVDAEKLQEVF